MKKIPLLISSFCCLTLNSFSQPMYSCKSGEASFFSEATLENIDAKSASVNSFLNTSSKDVMFIIPITGFKFKKELMREHFNEKYMESDKYPNANFKGKINENIDFTKDGTYEASATGKMNLHGVEKDFTSKGTITVKGGEIMLHTEFKIKIKDYNIEIPKLVIQNIAEEVTVKVDGTYVPFKK